MNKFEYAFNYLLDDEGTTYTNDPADSGGPTKFGITKKSYEEFLHREVGVAEVKNLSQDMAEYFYFWEYWKPMGCDQITAPSTAICIFDSGVLYGPGTAGIFAQKVASLLTGQTLKCDGVIGPKSIELINQTREDQFLKSYQGLLLKRIDTICEANPKNEKFRKGWTNRANRVLTLIGCGGSIDE